MLLDGMILTGRLMEFVDEFVQIHHQETEEQKLWEFYLHKISDQSYQGFKESVMPPKSVLMSKAQLETTVAEAKAILNNFNPRTVVRA